MKRIVIGIVAVLLIAGGIAGYRYRERIFGPSVVRLGAAMELSGPLASYGIGGLDAMRLAIDEANAAGGIKGKQIVLLTGDAATPSLAASCVEKLAADKALAIIGPCTTGTTMGAVPAAERLKLALITPSGSSPRITADKNGRVNQYVYRACFIDPEQGAVMARLATDNLNAKSVAMLVDGTLDYSTGLAEIFKDKLEQGGGKVVMEQRLTSGAKDLAEQIAALKGASPQAVFAPVNAAEAALFARQARAAGLSCPILGSDTWDDLSIASAAGYAAMQNVYFPTGYYAGDSAIRPFASDYRRKYGRAPNISSVLAYDAARLVIDAIRRAGELDREKINKAIAETRGFNGITGRITFDRQHNPDGKAVVVLTYKEHDLAMHAKLSGK